MQGSVILKKVLIIAVILTFALTSAIFAAPGDTNDPIVVLSYLNDRLEDLIEKYSLEDMEEIKTQINELSDSSKSSGSTNASADLVVVEIKTGEKIICGAGTELILRGGEAKIIGSELGGLTNVTLGKDFVSGMAAVPNNLLIVPRDDGRGVYTDSYAIFMVRGSYEVIK